MYSVQAGSQFDPVASNYRQTFSLSLSLFIHSLTLSLSDFLAPLRRRAQPDAAAATYNNASTLYRSTG